MTVRPQEGQIVLKRTDLATLTTAALMEAALRMRQFLTFPQLI